VAEHPRPARTLQADCSRCVGLCCVLPAFVSSAEFAIDKPAGVACPNLHDDSRCGIHDQLRARGFSGCVTYDCFGAGPALTEVSPTGRRHAILAPARLPASFSVLRQLHELLWLLTEARTLDAASAIHPELAAASAEIAQLADGPPAALADLDAAAVRARVNPLLARASELARGPGDLGPDRQGADLIGAWLQSADLRRANLRGARLIGADLRQADLRRADLTGADTRGADLSGADLTGALFVTQSQLDAARGNERTRLPAGRTRPSFWTRG
jgi:hypothetical protein